jgi:tetratricopeptide (TPR) repeat protein
MKQPDKALEYYQLAETLDPDSLNNQLNMGHCLLELNRYAEALKCYFKVEYLSPENKKVWRPIAWCSFLSGKPEQAEKYLLRLIEEGPNKHDFMNMGHVQWSLGNRKQALEYYRKSISSEGFTDRDFIGVFEEDLPHLLSQGIEEEDVPIMLDQLRYLLEE